MFFMWMTTTWLLSKTAPRPPPPEKKTRTPKTNSEWRALLTRIVTERGGSCRLSQLLNGYPREAREIKSLLGGLKPFLAKLGPPFVLSGTSGLASVRIERQTTTSSITKASAFDTEGVTIVSDEESCRRACELLRKEPLVAVDCEGVDLGQPGGKLCLVQVASKDSTFLFDMIKCPELLRFGLQDVLCDTQVVKAIHDCRMDVIALGENGCMLSSVLDTQVAFQVLNPRTPRASLTEILRQTTGDVHPEKDKAPHKTDHQFWQRRPLSALAVKYASADVRLLMPAVRILLGQLKSINGAAPRAHNLSKTRMAKALLIMEQRAGSPREDVELLQMFQEDEFAAETARTTHCDLHVQHELQAILDALPDHIATELLLHVPKPEATLVDVVMDLARPITFIRNNGPSVELDHLTVQAEDLDFVLNSCGPVTDANRACVGESLHRCSVIKDPYQGDVVGLTLRMARVVHGVAAILGDVLFAGKSVLLVGPPGRGKTTLLRDIARMLASREHDNRVMVVDTNNEIAGEAMLPHAAIGRARRMKVGARSAQYRKMLEAVQNHTPETLVIDEIGTPQEVAEAIGIQQRGVQLVATTHGRTLADIIQNPHLRNLLGGVNAVILSAWEREAEGATSKTRIERKMPPAFDVCVELLGLHRWRVHHDVAQSVDVILRGLGETTQCEVRTLDAETGTLSITHEPFPDQDTQNDVQTAVMASIQL